MHHLILGKAGEMRIASELLLRGFNVFIPTTDLGVDLTLDNGSRIQIKTSSKRITKTGFASRELNLK